MYKGKKEKVYTVIHNGEKSKTTYEAVCHDLGFNPLMQFVSITNNGTITFTLGKPHEVRALYNAVIGKGYKPSQRLKRIIKTL